MYPNQNMFVGKAHGSICISYFKMPLLSCSLFCNVADKTSAEGLYHKIHILQEVQ